MLGLKLPTDPRWVNIVEMNIDDILSDHAFCEQKATSTAISLIVSFPEYTELVQEMIALVKEEISHFKLVHDKIIARGNTLGYDRKDAYVNQLLKFFPKGGSRTTQLVHRLLYAALIEARSCERFRLLSQELKDEELRIFYHNLMVSEANHYTMFLGFARKYGEEKEVNEKWQNLLDYEAEIMKNLSKDQTIHG
ncbi:tRNA-(ms[2]io[6]A)-hydroxylase [Leeuwenhoekiella marinoflava]|uniref:tRNA-(Ms[2]io[6]A)-hydroxylase n=2 Tax=Leeuwenhoekiella marinoflava TaxID=988 RepID=A0A4Q0PRC7_9FLAO|nr:tRNA-(ms[2]io[6]A)-hydroxylase [Leeuwenhoekiella marinoflava]RXG32802.1 tRNA-(ms[2]io[6]A)-hydroxylase [Leeuwenhoekiella marinoflava]SHE57267.1 tRNA-(ms[2]io[6]A)-hydroxylase [Leeuwenhoekiella marinoflava DSM 3653]